jgi:hypothetical protein
VAQPDEATRRLIRRLTAGTKQGKVKWTASGAARFDLDTDAARIMVRSEEQDGDHPYVVRVESRDGALLGGGETIPGASYVDWEEEIAALYAAARSAALGVDAAYEELAQKLQLPGDPADDDIPF